MEGRTNRIQQLYGYAVCLIAVITFLIAASSLVNAVFDRMRPDAYEWGSSSFESYKREQQSQVAATREKTGEAVPLPSDSTLRREFESSRVERKANAEWRANKSMVTSSLMIVFAILLFLTHWRWVHRIIGSQRD
jgi:NADH:ubiquinone oxidoreductase subunit 3 (subunit A)